MKTKFRGASCEWPPDDGKFKKIRKMTYFCEDCGISARNIASPLCPKCRMSMQCLGAKYRIPKKNSARFLRFMKILKNANHGGSLDNPLTWLLADKRKNRDMGPGNYAKYRWRP